MLAEPTPMQGDVRFSITNIPIRISIWSWPAYAFFGWDFINDFANNGTFKIVRLTMWVLAVAGSILLHELGHAWAFRRFGISSRIVLYYFGGLAIPDGRNYREVSSVQQIIVSAAGPLIQLMIAAIVFAAVWFANPAWLLTAPDRFPFLRVLIHDLLLINTVWALFNLLPIYPLDGGQISRELFLMKNTSTGIRNSLILSTVTAVIAALFLFQTGGSLLMGMMMLSFAFSSYQTLQRYSGGGFGGGGGYDDGYGHESWR